MFTGGGTGGHVFPGIAVIERLSQLLGGRPYRIVWLGWSRGMERDIVARFSIPFYGIPAGKLRRYLSLRNITDAGAVAAGFFSSLYLLKKLDTALVFSKGGFVSVPPVAAARVLGIPSITHESDLDPGLATQLNARFTNRVLCAYEETTRHPRLSGKAKVTGNPVRSELFAGDRAAGRKLLGIPEGKKVVLVLGGSQGARQINRMVEAVLDRLLEEAAVVHQMGSAHYREDAPYSRSPHYLPAAVFTREFPHVLAAAALVVCRAGAGTLWENGVLGKPSILIPLGAGSSRGDQVRNASYFAGHGAAEVLSGDEVNAESLLEKCLVLLNDEEKRTRMGERAARLCPSDGAERIAREITCTLEPSEVKSGPAAGSDGPGACTDGPAAADDGDRG